MDCGWASRGSVLESTRSRVPLSDGTVLYLPLGWGWETVGRGWGAGGRGWSLQWCWALDLSCLCCEWQSCPLWVYSKEGEGKGQWKTENGNGLFITHCILGSEMSKIFLPCPPPKQDNIQPVKDLPPPNPQHTYIPTGSYFKKNPWQKLDRSKKKKKKTTFSVSWISKIFIWSLRFMAGPGNLVGSAQ